MFIQVFDLHIISITEEGLRISLHLCYLNIMFFHITIRYIQI